jgi:hypothetical protein
VDGNPAPSARPPRNDRVCDHLSLMLRCIAATTDIDRLRPRRRALIDLLDVGDAVYDRDTAKLLAAFEAAVSVRIERSCFDVCLFSQKPPKELIEKWNHMTSNATDVHDHIDVCAQRYV